MILKFRYDARFWQSLGWNFPTREIGPALISGLCLAIIVGMIGAALNTPRIDSTLKELLQDRPSMVLVGLFAVTAGPVCEELAFRGFIMPLLARSFGIAAGIILTAIPFALLHGPAIFMGLAISGAADPGRQRLRLGALPLGFHRRRRRHARRL